MKSRPTALFDMDGFNTFWEHYPRKENKVKARQAWAKLKPMPDALLLEAMRTWLEAASMSRQWSERSFIPHPATWINQRRWEGDPPPPLPRPHMVGHNPTAYTPPPCGQEAAHSLGVCDCQLTAAGGPRSGRQEEAPQ